jgi:putative ABC transport system permease protein
MTRIAGVRRLFRLRTAETVGGDVDAEIAFHLGSRVEELLARGMTPEEALRKAEEQFGDVVEARAELEALGRKRLRQERRAGWLGAVRQDVRHALRGMGRNVGFTAAVVLTLALGIGVNAAMFGITDRLLLRPPAHVVDPDRVVRGFTQYASPSTGELVVSAGVSFADYLDLREVGAFAQLAAYSAPRAMVVGSADDATEVQLIETTATYFPLLGVRPALGRFFAPAEDALPRGERVLVLSHGFWQSRFGGDPDVIGRIVEIDHAAFTVIGVAPRGFHGIDPAPAQGWILSSAFRAESWPFEEWYTTRNMIWLRLVARLAPGVTEEAARAEASAVFAATDSERYGEDSGVLLGSIIAARAPVAGGQAAVQRSGRIALWLLGVSGIVLVIACLNVANLLLARSLRRRREIGVRMAMGVGRFRLGAQVLTETLVIALFGAALGLLVAHWGGQAARSLLLPGMEWVGSPVDRRVLIFAAAAAFASALLAGLLPALHAARSDVLTLLSLGGRGSSMRRSKLRSGLVVLQAALSILLLVGAGLFVRSLQAAHDVPLGFDPDDVVVLNWHDAGLGWTNERKRELSEQALGRVQALPAVERAALSQSVPFWSMISTTFRLPDRDSLPRPAGGGPFFNIVTPDYFAMMRSRVLRGRAFSDADVEGAPRVAMVTVSLAQLLWPGEDALGKCIIYAAGDDSPCREIVGVVEDVRINQVESEHPTAMVYLPRAQAGGSGGANLMVRTRGDAQRALGTIVPAMRSLEPGLPYVRTFFLRDRIDPQLQPWRLGASLFTAFGVLALLLAAVGLYGVVSYDVTQRTREIGVRVALGARNRSVMANVVGGAVRLASAGVIGGLVIAYLTVQRLEPLLFRVSPRDPAVLLTAALLVVVVALAAALVPGGRAARVQPIEALRGE